MRLTPKTVGDLLEAILSWRVEMNPYGFEVQTSNTGCLVPARARLQRGSGIAGRGDVWMLVRLPGGLMPRFALGYLFFPLAGLVESLGVTLLGDTERIGQRQHLHR